MNKIYKIYGLIDPRSNKLCYIGYTTQTLKNRLRQHLNPKDENMSKIAKLQRYLNKYDKKLSIIEICNCKSEEEMYEKEIYYISHFKSLGYTLKNIQPGGKITINNNESYRKFKKTHLKNKEFHKIKKCEESHLSKLTNKDVLKIYKLIIKGYNNLDIIFYFKDKCKISCVKSIRNGKNWSSLFKSHLDIIIPSIKSSSNDCYTGYQKLKIIDLIVKNYELDHINKWFNKISKSDLKRIKNKNIWVPVWKSHEQISAYNKKLL
jgi:hypothetical protein